MGEERKVYRVFMGKPEGKRLHGITRCRWEDGIRMDLRETDWGSVDWIQLAQDKDQWQALVNMVMNLRVLAPQNQLAPNLEHRDPFGVSVITHTIRHMVGLLWTSGQPDAEASTYTGQHKRQTSMPRAGFEPVTPATKQPQTYALDTWPLGLAIRFYSMSKIPTV
jgi:hypothetical protein